jgi:large subunit ribosomal protein L17
MRHGDKIKNLGRKKAHRDALLANMACQLIVHKRIVTTLAKAKALRVYVEPLITKTKKNATAEQIMHQHRVVFSYLNNKQAVKELFTVIAPVVNSRPGGYTRIIKLGIRKGDNAEMAMIELVDYNTVYGKTAVQTEVGTRKTRRGRSKKVTEATSSVENPSVAKVQENETKETLSVDTPSADSNTAAVDDARASEEANSEA